MSYHDFIQSKRLHDKPSGIDYSGELNSKLFPFQRDIVRWALKRGRAAIFADCGLGKTAMQLEWARIISEFQSGAVLILAPLAVSSQTVAEGQKFGINAMFCADQSEVPDGAAVCITNYEKIEHFDLKSFIGVVLDESSILKSYMGKTKRMIIDQFSGTKFKLACTATPSPNDHMELGNHAEFLDVMSSSEMLARWFTNDTMHAGNYRLKTWGVRDFWFWVSSWAVALRVPSDIGKYSDDGYVLPKLCTSVSTIECAPPDGYLFSVGGTLSATEIHKAKRGSAADRAAEVAKFAAETKDQVLIWCDANYEADEIRKALPECVEVRGSDKDTIKTQRLMDFANGKIRCMLTKPSIAGFGMNFQNCHKVAFVGLSYSFEALYQALRRVWRFGQKSDVEVLIVEADAEAGIRGVVEKKIEAHDKMQKEMCGHMKEFQEMKSRKLKDAPDPVAFNGKSFTVWNGDCVQVVKEKIADNSIDFSVFSPPFANLYIYSDSIADMGNSADNDEFFQHFGYLIDELLRVTVNGRLCAVHCKDLPAYKGRDGSAGLIDFPGMIIREFEARGWQYHSRVTIWKDPVTEMQRTKNHGLLHKQLCKDSAASRQGMADYMVVFRKWAGDEFPRPVRGISNDQRFDSYIGENAPEKVKDGRDMSIQVWQRYASPVWFDIRQQRVLQGHRNATSENDEKHICPLQLDVIERCIHLWTNPGDLILSPFTGIGSEGVCAVNMGRRFVGAELKEGYWRQACKNIEAAANQRNTGNLFEVD